MKPDAEKWCSCDEFHHNGEDAPPGLPITACYVDSAEAFLRRGDLFPQAAFAKTWLVVPGHIRHDHQPEQDRDDVRHEPIHSANVAFWATPDGDVMQPRRRSSKGLSPHSERVAIEIPSLTLGLGAPIKPLALLSTSPTVTKWRHHRAAAFNLTHPISFHVRDGAKQLALTVISGMAVASRGSCFPPP